jgi:spore maturation protein SpmA
LYLGFRKTFIDIIRIDIANGLGDVSADLLNSPIHSGVIKANIFRDHGAVSTLVGNIVLTKFGLANWKKQKKKTLF